MKKMISFILAVVLLLSCVPAAFAADNSRRFFFELSVDGKNQKEAQPGDRITVVFTLNRTREDLADLAKEAEQLGVLGMVGLYQELK